MNNRSSSDLGFPVAKPPFAEPLRRRVRPVSPWRWAIWRGLSCFLALWVLNGATSLAGLGDFSSSDPSGVQALPYEFSAAYILERNGDRGSIRIVAKLADSYHIYPAESSQHNDPMRTRIRSLAPGIKVGPFSPNAPPISSNSVEGFEGQSVQWHEGEVVWTAPLEYQGQERNLASADATSPVDLPLTIEAQICSDHCIPVSDTILARFAGYYDAPAPIPSQIALPAPRSATSPAFRDVDAMAQWHVELSHATASPGQSVQLRLRGKPDAGFHLYEYAPSLQEVSSQTLIVLQGLNRIAAGPPKVQQALVDSDPSDPTIPKHYEGEVVFTVDLAIPQDHPLEVANLSGLVGYHVCSDEQCDLPRGLQFEIPLRIVDPKSTATDGEFDGLGATIGSVSYKQASYKQIAGMPDRTSWITQEAQGSELAAPETVRWLTGRELLTSFSLALLGGLLLNFMPCVLPVIGLKILGFVTEASGDRRVASKLTLVYSGGILAVVLALGILSLTARELTGRAYGWGEHFGMIEFRILSTSFMFALALSFLGVWEIPIPGFALGGKTGEMSKQSGYLGAFCKGVVTTLLATPCSAPFLGSALVVALNQPPWIVLLVFAGIGIGMALPYLLIALQPKLLSILPKPGPWMQTFKEFLAFPLLLAVVLFLSGFSGEQRIAMLASLVFLWFGCWMVGKVPVWESRSLRVRTWVLAACVTAIGSYGAFYWVRPSTFALQWTPYNEERLQALVGEGKPVLIDFTADWCLNCKQNLNTAIHTSKVQSLVDSMGIVAMEADLTDYPDHIKRKLAELKSISIPLLAIYRPGDMQKPIVLRDRVTEQEVLAALREVIPSKSSESATIDVFKSNAPPPIPMVQFGALDAPRAKSQWK